MLAQERQELQKCFSCNGLLLLIMAIRWIGMRERIRKNMYCVAEKKGQRTRRAKKEIRFLYPIFCQNMHAIAHRNVNRAAYTGVRRSVRPRGTRVIFCSVLARSAGCAARQLDIKVCFLKVVTTNEEIK